MKKKKKIVNRNPIAAALAARTGSYAGRHRNRKHAVSKGRSRKRKHSLGREPHTSWY